MNSKKIILGVASGVVAVIALAISINFVLCLEEDEIGSTVTFFTDANGKISEIESGESVAELGNLRFGKFALFQLTDDASRLELISTNYNEEAEMIVSARGRVDTGAVSAVNLLFGTELVLLDDRVAVINHGGSFIFEKQNESTIVRIFSGSAQITFSNPDNSELFEAVLVAGEKIEINDKMITNIFMSDNKVKRHEIWQNMVSTFSGNIKEESRLAGELLAEVSPQNFKWFDVLRKKLLFNSSLKSKFFKQEFLDDFVTSLNSPKKLDNLFGTSDENTQIAGRHIVPFARIFLAKDLSRSFKTKIKQLATTSSKIANFAGVDDISPATRLNRDLIFLLDDSENISSLAAFLAKKDLLVESDSETVALLFQLISKNSNLIAIDWVEAWNIANEKIASTDPAVAIAAQLALTQVFISDGRGMLAAESLKNLVEMVSRNQSIFSSTMLESIATDGNELKNRIIFSATLSGQDPFDEEIYNEWVSRKEKDALANDGKVSRPVPEFSKFLDMVDDNELENLLDKYRNGAESSLLECAELAENLENCAEYDCEFIHPLSGETLSRTISGISDGKCVFAEQIPGGGELRCEFDEPTRKKVAEFFGSDQSGKNPLDAATTDGACVISEN